MRIGLKSYAILPITVCVSLRIPQMAFTATYDQEVVFTNRGQKKVTHITLYKQAVCMWIPLQIMEVKSGAVFLHMSLSNTGGSMSSITLSVPLSSDLSSDVADYSCKALFQDDQDEKELIKSMKENSCLETFSVDVNHIPPSTYTVTGLGPPGSDDDVGLPTGLPQGAALHGETSVIEEKLTKLVLSSNSETLDKQTRASFLNNPEKIHKNQPSCVSLIFLKDTETKGIFPFCATNSEATFPFQLRPVTDYELVVFRGWETQKLCYRVHAVAHCSFKSYMTQMEVYELYKRALRHTACLGLLLCYDFIPVTHLYRSKPLLHFLDIYKNTNGIMFKYIKNFGGDPASTLNRKLHGLFFSANVDPTTGLPPPVSYYGDQRIHIPISLMITPVTNLYFADFYCHYVNHKVTLVVTLKGSEADNFCRSRLLSLSPSFNEFLYLSPGSHVAMVNTRVTVEVFYTESIDIVKLLKSKYAYITTVKQSGNPLLKTIVGIPKRKDCQICNLK